VVAALRSLTLTNPALCFDEPNKTIYRHPDSISDSKNKVSIICGGGSGHEPGWVGYVGKGFLTACVAGTIFASPSAEQVRACVAHRLPKDSKGLLVMVMNYTGDVLNFGMGAEKAKAMGKDVDLVIIEDDVGVGRAKSGKVGRRGIGGATFSLKVCGAMAEMGGSLKECAHVARLAGQNLVSIAASLSRVHVIGRPTSDADDELKRLPHGTTELGMGIHNEPGCEQLDTDLPGTVKKMLAQLLDQNDHDRAYIKINKSDPVALLINNFGGVSNLELGACMMEVWKQLTADYGIHPVRVYSGVFNGSLNGPGFGVSLLKLADTGLGAGKSLLDLVDYPSEVVGWPAAIKPETFNKSWQPIDQSVAADEPVKASTLQVDPGVFSKVLGSGLERVIAAEPEVTKYDSIVGDGDCGIGLKRGAEAIQERLKASPPTDDLVVNVASIINVVENTMDGTSGAIYNIFLNSLAAHLRGLAGASKASVTPKIWADALDKTMTSLAQYTPAKRGDRTLVDALEPFVKTLKETGDLKKAANAAKHGSDGTKGMKASLGRSVYVGGEEWKNIPDPGAHGLAEFLLGLAAGQ
jgi:triose/dihydroxyacetone kinase / FAD-AMP lyase (cyclizing)